MAILLSCRSLAKSYGPRPLFTDVALGISDGERLGLIRFGLSRAQFGQRRVAA